MRTQPSSLDSDSIGTHAREPKIDEFFLVRMILVLRVSEIDEMVINCEVDNDIELFSLLWKFEIKDLQLNTEPTLKLGVHEVLLGRFDGFQWW